MATGFFTKVKYAPSPGSNIWLLTPIVVGPPPWQVLIVLLALVKVPSALSTGVLPITTSAGRGVPTVPNRFWPEGSALKLNSVLDAGRDAEAGEGDRVVGIRRDRDWPAARTGPSRPSRWSARVRVQEQREDDVAGRIDAEHHAIAERRSRRTG